MVMKTIFINAQNQDVLKEEITACIGYFDGLHLGHQALVNKVLEISKKNNTIPALITFDPDPWTILRKIKNPPHLLSMSKRNQIIEELGIQLCIILQFDDVMANLCVDDFHKILNQLNVKTLVCGFDFHYGKQGSGTIDTLCKQSIFQVEVIDKISDHDEKISSSRIERLITHGEMEEANRLLTRPYQISGTIQKGNQLGRTYGFPTANLRMSDDFICPKRGVYIGAVVWHNTTYPAIINIGNNPTFNYQQFISIEAYILDFHENLYGETCHFCFYKHLRDEAKYPNKDALIAQLKQDKECAIAYFRQKKEYEHAIKSL